MNKDISLLVRPASNGDLAGIMKIMERARSFMASVGNPNQWIAGYPQKELMESEIAEGHCFVCINVDGKLVATFCFIDGVDPNYKYIEDGEWLNDKPYSVLHRLASDGTCSGIFDFCLEWCSSRSRNIRVDTHRDNQILQHLLLKHGFTYCGIIYVSNGTPRLAFQRCI